MAFNPVRSVEADTSILSIDKSTVVAWSLSA